MNGTPGQYTPELSTTLMNLAAPLLDRGDCAEAEALYRRALRLLESAVAAVHTPPPRRLHRLAELDRPIPEAEPG